MAEMRNFMNISEEILENFTIEYPLENLAPLEDILFLDIETTGFTARSSYIYMIGCAYYAAGNWHIKQWLIQNYNEESALLDAFFSFAKSYQYLIHFNGNNFDLPFIAQKCIQFSLPHTLEPFEGIDLYKRIAPYKFFLKLPNCKQKTIEDFLGINRKDIFSGGELIGIFHDYVKENTEYAENALFLHNADDLKGMLSILPMLAYFDLFHHPLKAKKVQANYFRDAFGNKRKELLMFLVLPTSLPKHITSFSNGCYFKAEGSEGTLKIPLYEEEMKFFYSNYKDYYYLPEEDVAMHKSVASFVDKEHRLQASAANCYTRKFSNYLPQWELLFEPYFKRDYKSQEHFFELTDEMKKDRTAFSTYASHVLNTMADTY